MLSGNKILPIINQNSNSVTLKKNNLTNDIVKKNKFNFKLIKNTNKYKKDKINKLLDIIDHFNKNKENNITHKVNSVLNKSNDIMINKLNRNNIHIHKSMAVNKNSKLFHPGYQIGIDKKVINSQLKIINMKKNDTNYVKGKMIGKGSYGEIYKIMDAKSGKIICGKCVRSDDLINNTEILTKEFKLIKSLSHPNIIKYLGKTVINYKEYYLMKYYPNSSLHNFIFNYGKLSIKQIKLIGKKILKGLSYLHTNSIFHGDIKADNIILNNNFCPKIIDFGNYQILKEEENNDNFNSIKG